MIYTFLDSRTEYFDYANFTQLTTLTVTVYGAKLVTK